MGEAHEEWLAELFGGRKTRASGNQWRDQMDGRTNRYLSNFAWAWDGKSTLSKSVSVSREMLKKAVEQAGAERPLIALRFYDDERLRNHDDWIVVRADDFMELVTFAQVFSDEEISG